MGNKIAIIMAVVLGVLAVLLVKNYIAKQEKAFRGEEVQVTIALKNMKKGSLVLKKELGMKVIPRKYWKGSKAVLFADRLQLVGNPLAYNIRAGLHMNLQMVDSQAQIGEGIVVRAGLRAYSMSVGGVRGVSGLLVLSDRVDVLGTFTIQSEADPGELSGAAKAKAQTMYLMKDVEVKALDRTTVGAVRQVYSTVTFELSPLECLVMEYAQNAGQVKLVKRNRRDRFEKYNEEERILVDKSNLMEFIKFAMSQRASKVAKGEDD